MGIYAMASHHYQPWEVKDIYLGENEVNIADLSPEDIWYAFVNPFGSDPVTGQTKIIRDQVQQARENNAKLAYTEWNWNGWYSEEIEGNNLFESELAKVLGTSTLIHAMSKDGDLVELATQSLLVGEKWGITDVRVDPKDLADPIVTSQLMATEF